MSGAGSVQGAFEAFLMAVREGRFPGPEHEY
jgi:ketopantoate hydroxymethyltransferase